MFPAMVRRAAFWFFLVLLAVGFGWAANEQWRLPFLGLFNWQADQQDAPEPDARPGAEPGAGPPDSVAAVPPVPERPIPQPAIPEPAGSPDSSVAEGSSPGGTPGAPAAAPATTETAGPAPAPAIEPRSQPPETAVAAAEPPGPPASDPEPDPRVAPPASSAKAEEASAGAPGAAPAAARESAASTAPAPQAETTGEGAPAAGPGIDAAADPAGARATAKQTAALEEPPLPGAPGSIAPTFDIVRVERDGRAVIAGRAAPGALVVVRSGDQVIDRVRASRRGDWVAVPNEPLRPGDQQLSAVAQQDDAPAVRSEQVVVVAVPDRAGSPSVGLKSAGLKSAGLKSAGPESARLESAALESADSQSVSEAQAAAAPVAVLLPRDGGGPGRLLQAPGRLSAEDTLALMTVSYDESGKVLLSGEAPPGVPVRIYVDNRPAAVVVGDVKGAWASSLDDTLAPGTYTLRLDQLDDKGQPVARIETPFTRVSDPPVEGQLQVDYVVVQPGNSLWRIARRLSGKGLDYLHIYDTNQSQIRDPDLIYPGQVFEIPVEVGSAG